MSPKIKNITTKREIVNAKLLIFAVIVTLVLAGLLFKIANLKIVNGDEFTRRSMAQLIMSGANNTHYDSVLNPNRGSILDKDKQPVAYSVTVYDVFIDVKMLLYRAGRIPYNGRLFEPAVKEENLNYVIDETFKALNELLGVPLDVLYSYVAKDHEGNYPHANNMHQIIARDISVMQERELMEMKEYLLFHKFSDDTRTQLVMRDVYTTSKTQREYIYKTFAPQIVGFQRGDGYAYGLENRYNTQLTGTPGRIFRAIENGYVSTERIAAKDGDELVMTLDRDLQMFCEQTCVKYATMYNAPNAGIIVMNPYTGAILAMAESPTFDVSDPFNVDSINDLRGFHQKTDLLRKQSPTGEIHEDTPFYDLWRNFNISSTIEPGSIFKPITIAAALEEGVISPYEEYYCGGHKIVNGIQIHCHATRGHGAQTLTDAMMNSCNVALMDIAEKMGREKFYKYLLDFGYGERTGIDLPAEETGILHSYAIFRETELATASFGQRFNCTPIQAITSFAALINGGILWQPFVISQSISSDGAVIATNEPTMMRNVISKETSDILRIMMEPVLSPQGTGRNARIETHAIGGKTGTAENGVRDTPLYSFSVNFIGYIPVENPQYLVLALVDRIPPDVFVTGTTSAAPMIREVFNYLIENKGIPAINDDIEQNTAEDRSMVGEYRDRPIAEVVKDLNMKQLDYNIVGGSGSAVASQNPSAGVMMQKGSTVVLTLKSDGNDVLSPIPDCLGLTAAAAVERLTNAGFTPVVVYDAAATDEPGEGEEQEKHIVYAQMPRGISIPKDTEVKIRVR
jgi:stage V sporulation protein D (sporulation-specific penicillin-binding protein)